jgi:hypothetical protein
MHLFPAKFINSITPKRSLTICIAVEDVPRIVLQPHPGTNNRKGSMNLNTGSINSHMLSCSIVATRLLKSNSTVETTTCRMQYLHNDTAKCQQPLKKVEFLLLNTLQTTACRLLIQLNYVCQQSYLTHKLRRFVGLSLED